MEYKFLELTIAHESNQSPRQLLLNSRYLISVTTPPSYTYREVSYGRAPYPTNARAKVTYGLQHEQESDYVIETPDQIKAMLQESQ